ncbi:toprim domain-containing protein [Chryseobacterium sp. Ch-15]|uniref:Toprim domain-containing protein n=1 Tax=Chryseobacterium muglaense TaxID=2893752 RepID=A0A9Q3YTF8_9FLAO|nr:toprim domain-containing protein [Chryseobacterium muglaense]MBD3906429.1 toprim domain-containing protein [Chryseobacterium muglaense]MCC9037086.1 toprim domain-containing protein [Chryseobacterium muglaense]MCM2556647.1 toprim domain-containing protein [Chryseobacterium muglaense]
MDYLMNWDKIKTEIDIEQYFLFKMGSLFSFDKYKQAYISVQDGKHGDIIRFFTHERTGVKMYYSIVFQDSGDIIQFIKKRILRNTNASPEEINRELKDYLGLGDIKDILKKEAIYFQKKSQPNEPNFKAYGNIIQKLNQHYKYLIGFRKLSQEVLESDLFNNIFFTYQTYANESLGFYLKNINGKIVGINRIQTEENEFFNKKWFDKDSQNRVGFTFSNKLVNTETLSIFESIFDAISFHEIYKLDSIQYCSTNGELSFRKSQLLHDYFMQNSFNKVILGNDNDLAGNYFNLNIIGTFIKEITKISKSENNICIELQSVAERKKINILLQFFKKSNSKFILDDDTELPQSYFTETLSGNINVYFFIIPNEQESIQFFVGLLTRAWDLESIITIYQPIHKDFNEDLIQYKNTIHG